MKYNESINGFDFIIFDIQIDAPTSDFIELYANEIAMLKRKVQALTKQNESLSESVSWQIEKFNWRSIG